MCAKVHDDLEHIFQIHVLYRITLKTTPRFSSLPHSAGRDRGSVPNHLHFDLLLWEIPPFQSTQKCLLYVGFDKTQTDMPACAFARTYLDYINQTNGLDPQHPIKEKNNCVLVCRVLDNWSIRFYLFFFFFHWHQQFYGMNKEVYK